MTEVNDDLARRKAEAEADQIVARTAIERERATIEHKKLALEVEDLRRSVWLRPSFITVSAPVLTAIASAFYFIYSSELGAINNAEQLKRELRKEQTNNEQNKLDRQVENIKIERDTLATIKLDLTEGNKRLENERKALEAQKTEIERRIEQIRIENSVAMAKIKSEHEQQIENQKKQARLGSFSDTLKLSVSQKDIHWWTDKFHGSTVSDLASKDPDFWRILNEIQQSATTPDEKVAIAALAYLAIGDKKYIDDIQKYIDNIPSSSRITYNLVSILTTSTNTPHGREFLLKGCSIILDLFTSRTVIQSENEYPGMTLASGVEDCLSENESREEFLKLLDYEVRKRIAQSAISIFKKQKNTSMYDASRISILVCHFNLKIGLSIYADYWSKSNFNRESEPYFLRGGALKESLKVDRLIKGNDPSSQNAWREFYKTSGARLASYIAKPIDQWPPDDPFTR